MATKSAHRNNTGVPSFLITITTLVALFAGKAQAAPTLELEYPELLVTPLASERLLMEAKREKGKRWRLHLPIQISALTTLTASILQYGNTKSDNVDGVQVEKKKNAAILGTAVGAGWLVATTLLSASYRPYAKGYAQIKKLPTGSKKERLLRERLAEETLESAGKLGKRLTWLSVITNLGASIYMLSDAEDGTISVPTNAIAAGASLIPLFFKHPWWSVHRQHRKYKKKIYGPVANVSFFPTQRDSKSVSLTPGLALQFYF